jgi:hypothetical protein
MNKTLDLYMFLLYNGVAKDEEITTKLGMTSREIRYAREEINSNPAYELSVDFDTDGRFLTADHAKLKARLLKTMRKQWKQLKKYQHFIDNEGQIDMIELVRELEEE